LWRAVPPIQDDTQMSAAKYFTPPTFRRIIGADMLLLDVIGPRFAKSGTDLLLLDLVLGPVAEFQIESSGRVKLGVQVPLRVETLDQSSFCRDLYQIAQKNGALVCMQERLTLVLGPEAGYFWLRQEVMRNLRQLQGNGIRLAVNVPESWAGRTEFLRWLCAEGKDYVQYLRISKASALSRHWPLLNRLPEEVVVIVTDVATTREQRQLAKKGISYCSGPVAGRSMNATAVVGSIRSK
jgi:hypothetical protein